MPLAKDKRAAVELSETLRETLALIHQRSVGDTLVIMNDAGITMAQMVTLFALGKFGEHSVCDIADRLHLSAAAASHLVERLVVAGLVERVEDAGDRRQKRVSISKSGEQLISRLNRSRVLEFTVALAKLSPALRGVLREVLEKVNFELRGSEPGRQPVRVHKSACLRARAKRKATR